MTSHFEELLQRDIDRIRGKLCEMFGLVERGLNDSLKAFLDGNRQLAYLVILRDQRIDELENEIDRLCLEFLVRQQPVAAHLRFVYVSMKLNQEMERIGDYAESISRQSLKLHGNDLRFLNARFQRIAETAVFMLRDAVRSFLERNSELAFKTMETESLVDELRNQIDSELMQFRQGGQITLETLPPLMTMARRFERVADQAKNICEEVIYMCTGERTRHLAGDVFRVLFVDQTNACLSQMAEAIGNSLGEPKFVFGSAGIQPGTVDPQTLRFLSEKGIDVLRVSSKQINQVPNLEHYQVVVLLGANLKPLLPKAISKKVRFEWEAPNPLESDLAPEQARAIYEQAFQSLTTQTREFIDAVLDSAPNSKPS
jgi:phosphate transport system protein